MTPTVKPVIFTFISFYLPGYRGGGPIRSIANMVERLSNDYEFLVVTTDRDLHDQYPYENVNVDAWNQVGKAKVFYASPSTRTFRGLTRLLRETKYDLLYLNSFFDATYTMRPLLARWLKLVTNKPTIVAPRGEFSEGAFKLKLWKKASFVKLARLMGMYDGITWHASTEFEAKDIHRVMVKKNQTTAAALNVSIAPDLLDEDASNLSITDTERAREKRYLSICFLSRLSPMKNLDFALRVLARVSVPVQFTIYGPQEDQAYWLMCQALIEQLPKHIKVTYAGGVFHELVRATLEKHDLFFLPTRGENFGHVFLEAWSAGLPVLVSDQTPWRDLERQRLGWDVSLDVPDGFVRALEVAAKFDNVQWEQMRQCCRQFASEQARGVVALELNQRLFSVALGASMATLATQPQTNE